jgi:hypothetical protein
MEVELFNDAADVLRSLLAPPLDAALIRPRRWGMKVWFGTADPGKEHYEAQIVGARHVPEANHLALEIGFHSEHPKVAQNQQALDALVAAERRWRRALGQEPCAGPFLGRDSWRRLSETWVDPDLSDPDLAVEVGSRLFEFISALEPLRGHARSTSSTSKPSRSSR